MRGFFAFRGTTRVTPIVPVVAAEQAFGNGLVIEGPNRTRLRLFPGQEA